MAELEPLTPPLDDGDELDRFISPEIRARLEERYWRPIERATVAEIVPDRRDLLRRSGCRTRRRSPITVSSTSATWLAVRLGSSTSSTAGCCRRARSERRQVVEGSAVLMAYLHDIGMVAATPLGGGCTRSTPRTPRSAPASTTWPISCGRPTRHALRSRIEDVGLATTAIPGDVVLREVLALSLCHSKSAVPAHLLDDPVALRALMIRGAFTSLDRQTAEPRDALRTVDVRRDRPRAVRRAVPRRHQRGVRLARRRSSGRPRVRRRCDRRDPCAAGGRRPAPAWHDAANECRLRDLRRSAQWPAR